MPETLITPDSEAGEAAAADATTTTQTDAAAPEAQSQAADTQGSQAADPQTEGKDGSKADQSGAPESYEFKPIEGIDLGADVIDAYSGVAKELGLPQDKAQLVLDKMAPVIAARQASQVEAIAAQWTDAAKADKEFGGDKLDESLATARKALDAFGTPELRELLNVSGLGNNPEVIRFMVRAGKAVSEDVFVSGRSEPAKGRGAQSLYSASNMNP